MVSLSFASKNPKQSQVEGKLTHGAWLVFTFSYKVFTRESHPKRSSVNLICVNVHGFNVQGPYTYKIKEMLIIVRLSNFDTTNLSEPVYVSNFDHGRIVMKLKKQTSYCNDGLWSKGVHIPRLVMLNYVRKERSRSVDSDTSCRT